MKKVLSLFGGDRVIWILLVLLTVYSVLAVSSSVVSLTYTGTRSVAYHVFRHSAFLLVGWGVMYIVHLIPFKYYSIFAQLLVLLSVVLLVYTLFRGSEDNEAVRRIEIGPFELQTSDFAKVSLIIFVARYLSRNQLNLDNFWKGFFPVIAWITLICALIQPENLSTALIIFTVCLIMLFIGRVRIKYILILFAAGIVFGSAYFLIFKSSSESRVGTWESRIERYFNPSGKGFVTIVRIKAAISNGGLFGKFAGHSTQKHSLPQAYSDFIFAIIVEEYGLIFGALPLLFLYVTLLFRAAVIVRRSDLTFPAFLAMGLSISIVFQALIHMGVAVGLLPVTGQTLPWISRGGSSILFTAVSFGIILGISRSLLEKRKETEHAK